MLGAPSPSSRPSRRELPRNHGRIRAMVDDHLPFVTRTLAKAGVSGADIDDEVQRTFIAASSRLDDVRFGAERSFLFQVARNTASHARRTLARRREVPSDCVPEQGDALATPENLIQRKQIRQLLDDVLAAMPESLRAVFVLHELEGMELTEIGARLGIPRGTVASRVRRARALVRNDATAIELAWDLGVSGETAAAVEPGLLRRERRSAFEHALLHAGVRMPATGSAHAGTLACLALRG